ncbi:MAG: TolC family protein [Armatimonadetes bacterium]|nr:TolC family protein [Armatimonadota bacterium]
MRTTVPLLVLVLLAHLVLPATAAAQVPRPLSLADLAAAADQRNPQITAARQAVVAAEARVLLARAGRGPTVTVSVGPGVSGGTSSTAVQGLSTSATISTSYVLYDSGQIAHAVRQAEANLKAARMALEATRQDVALAVAVPYVNILRAERNVQLRQQIVVQNQELLRLAEGQFRAGVVARADVVRAQAGLAAAEGELIAARNAVDQTKAALNAAVGQPAATPIAAAPPPAPPRLTLAAAALVGLVDERPEVKRVLAEIEAAEAALALAQAGGGIRVTLDGRASQSYNPTTQPNSWSISSTVSYPVSDAGRVAASVAEATANLAAAKARIETTRLSVQQQSLQAFLSILDGRARIESARAGLAFAQESLRLAQGRYAAGAGPFLEVIDAQTALVQAEVALARAEFDELAGALALRHALGRSVVDGAI